MRTNWATIGIIAAAAAAFGLGCDSGTDHGHASTTQTADAAGAPAATTGPTAGSVALEPKKRISLLAIPFTAEVPASWDVQSGPDGRPVLHGRVPSGGEIDILLAARPRVHPEALATLIKETTTQPSTSTAARNPAVRTRVTDRGGMKLIETIERTGPEGRAPEVTAYSWTVRYVNTGEGGKDYPVHELNVPDLSGVMVTSDQDFIRAVFESLQPEAAAPAPAP